MSETPAGRPHEETVRLTVLVSTLVIGGAEQLLLELLSHLDRRRFPTHVCFLHEPGRLGEELLKMGYPATVGVLGGKCDPAGVFRLAADLRSHKTDVLLLINHRNTLFYGVCAARLAGVPGIINWQNETFRKYSLHRVTMAARRWVTLGIDRVVAAAAGHADYLMAREGVPRRKVRFIYNGVDADRVTSSLSVEEARRRLRLPADARVAVMVAAFRPDKAQDILIEAAATVVRRLPDAHFLLAGDGTERERLTALVLDLGLRESIHFLGFRRDIGDVLRASDVCVLSTRPEQETLSVAVIEAMSAGLPVVSSDVGFMSEIVIPGQTGELAPHGDPHALADKLLRLMGDPALCRRMGQAARSLVAGRLTVARMVHDFEDLFVEVAEEKRGLARER